MTCEKCQAEVNAWLDHRTTYKHWMPYSSSPERRVKLAIEGYHLRAEEHYSLVRRQIALIRESCKKKHS